MARGLEGREEPSEQRSEHGLMLTETVRTPVELPPQRSRHPLRYRRRTPHWQAQSRGECCDVSTEDIMAARCPSTHVFR